MARKQGCHCRQCKQCVLHFSNNLTQIKMCRKTMRAGKAAERQRSRPGRGTMSGTHPWHTGFALCWAFARAHVSHISAPAPPARLLLPCVKYLSLLTRLPIPASFRLRLRLVVLFFPYSICCFFCCCCCLSFSCSNWSCTPARASRHRGRRRRL